jgi:hypothetical protein
MRSWIVPLAVLGSLVVAAPASAAFTTRNLITNGDAEAGPGATDSSGTNTPPGWQTTGSFTAVQYGSPDFLTTAQASSWSGGLNFFTGGTPSFGDDTLAVQQIDLTEFASQINGGKLNVTLSGLLGGFASQPDAVTVVAAATDAAGSTGTALSIGPVTPADRDNQTTLLPKTACVALPAGVTQAVVSVDIHRSEGSYNDGYLDNLSLVLSDDACSASTGELPPAAPPVIAKTANADVVSGVVKVKVPGSNEFVTVSDPSQIPLGSQVDASKGVVQIQTAADKKGKTQTGKFSQGVFTMSQDKAAKPTTTMTLSNPLSCSAKLGAAAKQKVRKLFGDTNKGRFRTRGRHATATVRGTQWLTKDSCDKTTVTVKRGTVIVRDLVKRKNVTVKAPHSYTARAKKRK